MREGRNDSMSYGHTLLLNAVNEILKCICLFHSIGKQMVSNAHPAPWFANTVSRFVGAEGAVADRDSPRWVLLPVSERSGELDMKRNKPRHIVLDVRLLARVNLVDDRGCMGPAGNATAYGNFCHMLPNCTG